MLSCEIGRKRETEEVKDVNPDVGITPAGRHEMSLTMTLSEFGVFSQLSSLVGCECACMCVLAQSGPFIDSSNKPSPKVSE